MIRALLTRPLHGPVCLSIIKHTLLEYNIQHAACHQVACFRMYDTKRMHTAYTTYDILPVVPGAVLEVQEYKYYFYLTYIYNKGPCCHSCLAEFSYYIVELHHRHHVTASAATST